MKPLHPSIRTVWRISLGIFWGLVMIAVAILDVFQVLGGDGGWLPTGVRTLIAVVIGTTIIVVIPSLRYRFWRYELRDDELFLRRGIWNRVYTVVPLRRIQHLDVSQNVLEREFSLGKLIVHTAGTQSNNVVVPGLEMEEAEHLRDTLKHYILENTV